MKNKLVEVFADNGEHSHWKLIEDSTGAVIWSEYPEYDKVKNIPGKLIPSFYFMKENKTFIRIEGNSLDEIKKKMIRVANENPYGMICSTIISSQKKELTRIGGCHHVDKHGNFDVTLWMKQFYENDFLKSYFEKISNLK